MNIIQIYKRFPTEARCIEHLESVRWAGTPKCPYCGSEHTTPAPKESRHHCNKCNTTFCVTVGTVFHNTKLDLQKWFLAISLVLNAKKGISSRQLARDLEVSKDTAWSMQMRLRKAFDDTEGEMLKGIVEMDETYVGGNPRKGGAPKKRGRGTGKTPVVGMVERGGRVKAMAVGRVTAEVLGSLVKENVKVDGTTVMTDEFAGYSKLVSFIAHLTVNHGKQYVDGDTHTNTIEGFWSLLKRGIVGQYHRVSIRYLDRYISEFCFRYNHRRAKGADVFDLTLLRAVSI